MWYNLKDNKPIDGKSLLLKLKDGAITGGVYDSTISEYTQANLHVVGAFCEGCGEDYDKFSDEIIGWVYAKALEEMDKELDLVHECLTDLYNLDEATPKIVDCLDEIKKMREEN